MRNRGYTRPMTGSSTRSVSVIVPAHGPPRLPGDPQDHGRDRDADQRVRNRGAGGDRGGAGHHGKAHVGVGAGVVSIGDQCRTVEPLSGPGANASREQIAEEADQPSGGEDDEVIGCLRVDQTRDRLGAGDAGRDEDRGDYEQPRDLLGAL
jgi:hypothetical protein